MRRIQTKSRSISPAWPCALIVIAAAALSTLPVLGLSQGRFSALIRMSPSDQMSELALETDPNFVLVPPAAHYDGVYFYTIARDPLARGPEHLLIDRPAYRYGHAGYGLMASFVSLGQDRWIPLALFLVGLGGVGIAAGATAVLARDLGFSPWVGLGIALNPGIVYAVTVATSESVGAAMLAVSLLAWVRKKWLLAAVALTLLSLIKETFLVVPAALALYELVQFLRRRHSEDLAKKALVLSSGPVVFAAWYLYLRVQFGIWPHMQVLDIFAAPFTGWVDSLTIAGGMSSSVGDAQIGQISVALLIAVGTALLIGLSQAIRIRDSIDSVYVFLAATVFFLGPLGLVYPKELVRLTSMPLMLLPAVLVGPRKSKVATKKGEE